MSGGDQIALLLACGILAASAASDLQRLRIPNTQVILMLCLFLAAAPLLLSISELQARLVVAAIAFGIGFSLFFLRLSGRR
jgi:Flp pilus assembly protein protease CpaA